MNRSLALLSSAALLAVSASAQCFTATGTSIVGLLAPTSTWAVDDEGRTSDILLPFAFPIGGQSWTHLVVESNGEIYLTMGTGVVGPAPYGIDTVAEMTGVAGDSPRVCAFGGDLQGVAGLATWDILLDDTVPGQVKVTWTGMRYFVGTEDFAMSVTLFDTGAVELAYPVGNFGAFGSAKFAGVSAGNGVATSGSVDLSAGGDTAAEEICFQNVWGWDLASSSILLVPNGTSGFTYVQSCSIPPASHTVVGAGCYDGTQRKAAYSYFADTVASQVLAGQSQMFLPNGNGYTILPGGGAWVDVPALAGAVNLSLTDDSEVDVTPSVPFNFLGTTPIATLSVNSNGFVNMGPIGGNYVNCYGSVYELHAAPVPSFRSNADFDPGAAGSGAVWVAEDNGVLYASWEGVYRWGHSTPEQVQFQLDLASGIVTVVFGQMATTGYTGLVLGYNGAGPCTDFGSLAWPAGYPATTADVDVVAPPMSLTASPTPVLGTLVDYTVNDAMDYIPGFDIGVVVVSTSPSALPLQVLDPTADPSCIIRVGSLDATLAFAAPSGPQTVQFLIPAGAPAGVSLSVQAVALVPGLNGFLGGVQLSNGITSYIESF